MQWPDSVVEYLPILQVLVPIHCFCQNQVVVKCVPTQFLRPSYGSVIYNLAFVEKRANDIR